MDIIKYSFLTFFLCGFLFNPHAEAAKEDKIVSIKGHLFYHGVGKWSEDITDKNFHIWNPSIGEGSLKYPSQRTLFIVEAATTSRHLVGKKIYVKVTQKWKNKSKVVHESTHGVDFLEGKQNMHIPILLNTKGIGDYTVTAFFKDDLSGKPVGKVKNVTINYGGGE